LSCTPRLPVHTERLVFDVIPPHPDAEPQASTTQQIGLGGLFGNDAGLALRRDQHAARKTNSRGDRCKKTECYECLVEGVFLIIAWRPSIACRHAEDVVRNFYVGIAQSFRCLRPVTDLCGIGADISGRKKRIESHGALRVGLHCSVNSENGLARSLNLWPRQYPTNYVSLAAMISQVK